MLDGASAEGKRVTSRGRPASEGVAVEAHQDPKTGPEEREARRSRGGDDEDSGAQPAEEGTREGRVVFASHRWEMECIWVSVSAVSFVGSKREERAVSWERE
jgi:hypothetical protein